MSPPGSGAPGCATHGHISDELRAVVEQFADRLQPWLERMAQDSAPEQAGQDPGSAAEPGSPCTWCPICALITVLRGDRPEAVARLAEHGAGLIAAARELLTPPAEPAPQQGEPAAEAQRTQRQASVQHIVVRPAAGGSGGVAGC